MLKGKYGLLIIGFCLTCLISVNTLASSYPNEPIGFKGWTWGTTLEQARPWIAFYQEDVRWGCKLYRPYNENYQQLETTLGEARLINLTYYFHRDILVGVSMFVPEGTGKLYDEMLERFGEPTSKEDTPLQRLIWEGSRTRINANYTKTLGRGQVVYLEMFSSSFYMQYIDRRSFDKGSW